MVFREQLLMLLTFKAICTKTAHINDPEPEVTWTPPARESDFKNYVLGANYSGLLYAGRVEFSWIVDIRSIDDDQEYWSVGNLVTNYHVLTTCRAVDVLQEISRSQSSKENDTSPSDYVWSKDVYRHGCDLRIYYCRDYLRADSWNDASYVADQDFGLTGWRAPKEIIRHVLCHSSDLRLLYDAAVIVLNRGIPPIPPRLGYMPTGYNYVTDEVKEMVTLDPSQNRTRSLICYVVSFGRNYVNHREFYALDYKVKFRVYITSWSDCQDQWRFICPSNDISCEDPSKYQNVYSLMCLRPRAKVGTVCDHDKSAPVVCDGQVIGLVIRGAEFQYCNNLYKIPFVAEKIDNYRQFADDTVSYLVHPVPKKTKQIQTTSPSSRAKSRGIARVHFFNNPFFILSVVLLVY